MNNRLYNFIEKKQTSLLFSIYLDSDKNSHRKYPQDIEILGWCPAGPVLPHGEKVPL